MSATLADLAVPVVQAPMAGGVGTPALVAAVSNAGGLGSLAAGYLTPDALRAQIAEVRRATSRPFGVNIFSPPRVQGEHEAVAKYAEMLKPWALTQGVALGDPAFDDDGFTAKIAVLLDQRPAVASFTFGAPSAATTHRLHAAGIEVWVTVTDPREATEAMTSGADVLVAQGAEAGGHRGAFEDRDDVPLPLVELLARLGTDRTIVAAGGLMDGPDIAGVQRMGAAAAQMGTAFLLCNEAGTSPAHRKAIAEGRATTLTRAFTGRRGRSLVNGWTDHIGDVAPSAYPQIHHLTAPLRIRGRITGDPDLMHLWAGTGHDRARAVPAAEVMRSIAANLR
jgi:nitronate monooxygenase